MVQKGLGWLLREAAKANPEQTVAYLMTIRDRTPRLVLAHRLRDAARSTRTRLDHESPRITAIREQEK